MNGREAQSTWRSVVSGGGQEIEFVLFTFLSSFLSNNQLDLFVVRGTGKRVEDIAMIEYEQFYK